MSIEYALKYATAGWSIFPLAPNHKTPIAGSKGFKDATTDPATITQLWKEHPNANIGMATGKASGVWVIDIDMKKGKDGAAALKAFAKSFPDEPQYTKRVQTPTGGLHLYIKYDDLDPVRNRADVLSGVDIRGDGGYVVLPPSITDLGAYTWAKDADTVAVAPASSWYAALPRYYGEARVQQGHGAALKRDQSRKLPWDMVLHTGRDGGQLVEAAVVSQKYTCRCPFHDDARKSAFFLRKSATYGFLYCSACDTSWATEGKFDHIQSQISIIEARLAKIKEERNVN